MSNLQAVVFDMDDTLYPESSYVLSGFRSVAEWAKEVWDIPVYKGYSELERLFYSGVRGDTFNLWLESFGKPAEKATIQQLVSVYRDHQPHIKPFPEIESILYELQATYRIGLVSDGFLGVQQKKFAGLGLAKYFDAVVFSDTWGRESWKPSTKPFIEVLAQLQVEHTDALYIGDNATKDFLGANQLGMKTIWYQREGSEYLDRLPPTDAHEPTLIITSYADFMPALHRIGVSR